MITKILIIENEDKYISNLSSLQFVLSSVCSLIYISSKLLNVKLIFKILNYDKYIVTLNIYSIIFFNRDGKKKEKREVFLQV